MNGNETLELFIQVVGSVLLGNVLYARLNAHKQREYHIVNFNWLKPFIINNTASKIHWNLIMI